MGFSVVSSANHKYPAVLVRLANNLRKAATPAERKLWQALQQLRLSSGIRFRRQQPIGSYIADFYCAAYKCVIEIDGQSHETKSRQDKARDDFMKQSGIHVFRFTEKETVENPEHVLQTVVSFLSQTPPLTPPSRGGE